MVCVNASNAGEDAPVFNWKVIDGMLSMPVTVTEKFLDAHKPEASKTKRYQTPRLSPNPHTIFELTLWESTVPGITIITKKHIKDLVKKRPTAVILSYLSINVDAYSKYLRAHEQVVPNILMMNPRGARARYPNALYDEIDTSGTGTLSQSLAEYG
ncbi:MAG: hypothetical protein KJO79_06255, partial [Verrucomicrobiae bacterium]|nr:hypothetical protein [Verrucomicrobiae bacterium]NNJ86764.1 hypothetical protein [Akkermansiaceae bacterium]